jgi:ribosome maturation factor RimP
VGFDPRFCCFYGRFVNPLSPSDYVQNRSLVSTTDTASSSSTKGFTAKTTAKQAVTADTLFAFLEPLLTAAHYELVDVEFERSSAGSIVRCLLDRSVDHPDGPRIDLDGVADATRLIDAAFEEHDPVAEAFTLEVSSPGLERPLKTPAHFQRHLSAEVAIKTIAGTPGERRIHGRLTSADAESTGGIVVAGPVDFQTGAAPETQISYASIDRARTVFRWGEEETLTSSGAPRKKGALPKGQRPAHPKAQLKADPPSGEVRSSTLLADVSQQPVEESRIAPEVAS